MDINTILQGVRAERESSSIITVVGVGGAGGNAVNHMFEMGIHGVDFLLCNTDKQDLAKSRVPNKIQLGDGLGAGNKPEVGAQKAVESADDIRLFLERSNTKMLFLTAGMGGGTGTGASPVIAKIAREMGVLTVAIVTVASSNEGAVRYNQGLAGLEELKGCVDSIIIIKNENITKLYGKLPVKQAFKKADEMLCNATKGIAEIITLEGSDVHVDFADVSNVIRNSGRAHMSVVCVGGENRVEEAVEQSLNSPLLDQNTIVGAKNILINFSAANTDTIMLDELHEMLDHLQAEVAIPLEDGTVQDANIIWGLSTKEHLEDGVMEIVMVATGFGDIDFDVEPIVKRVAQGGRTSKMRQPKRAVNHMPNIDQSEFEMITLGESVDRFEHIEDVWKSPAYIRRGVKLVNCTPPVKKAKPKSVANGAVIAPEPSAEQPSNNRKLFDYPPVE